MERTSHKLWRKFLKKRRRTIKRRKFADHRDEVLVKEQGCLVSDLYSTQKLIDEKALELVQEELACERRIQWKERDLAMHTLWLLRLEKKKIAEEKIMEQKTIRREFETDLNKENEKWTFDTKGALLQQATSQLGTELQCDVTHNPDPPPSYIRPEMRPRSEPCPFFTKTGACRFGINCSREHKYPEVSHTVLLTNMYTHFGMIGASVDDYDSDIALEYTDTDNYMHFSEFFEDVLPEFQKIGKVSQFKTCNNKSSHLRGNVYVQFEKLKHAENAVSLFNGRWYAGRQISCIFVPINRWKSAICGQYWSKKCPKGNQCNFLHVFRNPRNAFHDADLDRPVEYRESGRSHHRDRSTRYRFSKSHSIEQSIRSHSSYRREERKFTNVGRSSDRDSKRKVSETSSRRNKSRSTDRKYRSRSSSTTERK